MDDGFVADAVVIPPSICRVVAALSERLSKTAYVATTVGLASQTGVKSDAEFTRPAVPKFKQNV